RSPRFLRADGRPGYCPAEPGSAVSDLSLGARSRVLRCRQCLSGAARHRSPPVRDVVRRGPEGGHAVCASPYRLWTGLDESGGGTTFRVDIWHRPHVLTGPVALAQVLPED